MMGRKTIKMAALREVLERYGFGDVQTYIQSGNIVLKSTENEVCVLEEQLGSIIEDEFGFEVPVLVETPEDIAQALDGLPEGIDDGVTDNKVFVMWYRGDIDAEKRKKFEAGNYSPNRYCIMDGIIYFASPKGAKKGLYTGDFEKKLGIVGTTRNIRTLRKMVEMGQRCKK